MKGLPIFWTRMAVELIPMSLYTHTPRVLPIHFGRETVPSESLYTHTPRVLPIHFGRETVPSESLYTHTPRVLPIHFGRETVPSGWHSVLAQTFWWRSHQWQCGQFSYVILIVGHYLETSEVEWKLLISTLAIIILITLCYESILVGYRCGCRL